MNHLSHIRHKLKHHANPQRKETTEHFFKTKKGQYGAHDVFMGVRVPVLRTIAKQYKDLTLQQLKKLLASKIHEERFIALVILVHQFEHSGSLGQKKIYDFYLKNIAGVNNWDLVDVSAHKILGAYLLDKNDRSILKKLAHSDGLWKRRIAIVSTWAFIRGDDLSDTFMIAEMLLHDTHDLIHKAVGWMLREAGKRDINQLKKFLDQQIHTMPRTMVRYAIEKFPEPERQEYLMR